MVEIIAEFIPSPFPEYNGRNRNEWKNNIKKIANIGVENTTKYFTESGLKKTKGALSRSWLFQNAEAIRIGFARRKEKESNECEEGEKLKIMGMR